MEIQGGMIPPFCGKEKHMEILLILVSCLSNIVCLIVGAKVGQAVSKGEAIETPTLNPIKAMQEHADKKQAKAEQERIETIMRNIESYDGTGANQEDVPRG